MRFLALLAFSIAIALGFGTWSAVWSLDRSSEFGTETVGPWHANPLAGSVEADPYAKAHLARIGNLTLGLGEGVVFRAERDSQNQPLRLECAYRLTGQTPLARVWTLVPYSTDGRLIAVAEGQPGWLVSHSLLRSEDNAVTIAVSPVAMDGNWLAVAGAGPYILALTLYDTPASTSSGLGDREMPAIAREFCIDG